MIICKQVLTKDSVTGFLENLKDWTEGLSALGTSHKDNQEIKNHPLSDNIKKAILNHPKVQRYGMFKHMTRPRFNRYFKGGNYKDHVDFFRQEGIRTDWSMTLFLTDDYEGGELVVEGKEFKLAAGDMILYPSGLIHRVNPVTKGTRIAAIAWAESYIEDYGNRKIVSTLADIIENSKENQVELSYVYNNLLRKWSDG